MTPPQKYICDSELIEKKWLNDYYYTLRFQAPQIASISIPGQFVNLKISHHSDPLLRRPMSIFRCDREGGWIEFLLKVVGKGTRIFAEGREGDLFGLLGPLGNGFSLGEVNEAIFVGGGIGVAPLIYLAEFMGQDSGNAAHFIQGFRNKEELCLLEEISTLADTHAIVTDDGSFGHRGDVAECLDTFLRDRNDGQRITVFACGPNPMMHAISAICSQNNLRAQFAAEAHMACGFGVCVGCPLPRGDGEGYHLACVDGPVFDLGEVRFA